MWLAANPPRCEAVPDDKLPVRTWISPQPVRGYSKRWTDQGVRVELRKSGPGARHAAA